MQKVKSFFQRIFLKLNKHPKKSIVFFVFLIVYYFSLPKTLFDVPYSTVILSKEGVLLDAKIALDGQWRFPAQDSLPNHYKTCLLAYEDQHFYYHWGFNPVSIFNAFRQNQKANTVVRGGSTLTQQVIRLHRKNKKRTYLEKITEIFLATRLEFRHSKSSILNLYAAHAPFGGNVVGLEMATWRYFGTDPHNLSWAEAATLAVLPNAPSLIYPGKNQEKLKIKRNKLLLKLYQTQKIDQATYQSAILEPLPQKPFNLPKTAPHLLDLAFKEHQGKRITTTIDSEIQNRANAIVNNYYLNYKQNEIYNLAVLIIDVETRNIISYIGNTATDKLHQKDVDIIKAPRSTGSILKPLLFAAMLDDGEILPNTLVADVPTQISGYSPQNFDFTYDGAVPAKRALSRSLNIPAVLMLQDYSIYKFYEHLQKYKLKNINKHPNHYGLSLILGGAESNLWDLCKTYAGLSGTLNHYAKTNEYYRTNEFCELNYLNNFKQDFGNEIKTKNIVGAGSIYLTYDAMKEVNRPEGDEAWQFYDSALEIAWKTGTSFGNRDAWAIGTNKKYVIGVWVGNATGEGRPNLTGVSSAAPVLFDLFRIFPREKWFQKPLNDLEQMEICSQSGMLPNEYCTTQKQWTPFAGKKSKICNYHQLVHLDKSEQFQVNSSCELLENMVSKPWFVLPPVQEHYYISKNINYIPLPPLRPDCLQNQKAQMDFIYPKAGTKIILTKNFDSKTQPVIIKVAHAQKDIKLFWYLNEKYLGSTQHFHDMPIQAKTGTYYLSVTDENGNEIKRRVEIVRN
jgi:penicillin-binding protein 1C